MEIMPNQKLSGWGRYPVITADVVRPTHWDELVVSEQANLIARGQGRSYGDAALLSQGVVMLTDQVAAIHAFDEETGWLTADAGLTIERILDRFVPRGWFPAITPGTKFVSLGGAVAADVHGKNHHHDGSQGQQLRDLSLTLADGSSRLCSPQQDAGLFWATLGGMGLTGLITEATVRLIPIETSSISAEYFQAPDLDTAFRWLEDSAHDDRYTVAWIDCLARGRSLGRSVVMRGHHTALDELPAGRRSDPLGRRAKRSVRVPFDFPAMALNPFSISVFNHLYYHLQGRKKRPFLIDYDAFFYPLDGLVDWNRMYGRRGFLQYQVVIPGAHAREGMRCILERLAKSRMASFLAVLKRFGAGNPGPLSFPMEGYTLALDLPMTGQGLLDLLDGLDDDLLRYGGRVYLAKDARLRRESLATMYPRLDQWLAIKRAIDPHDRFASDLSRRLGLSSRIILPNSD
jgi:FAD/FMN-containing dehydrogenase